MMKVDVAAAGLGTAFFGGTGQGETPLLLVCQRKDGVREWRLMSMQWISWGVQMQCREGDARSVYHTAVHLLGQAVLALLAWLLDARVGVNELVLLALAGADVDLLVLVLAGADVDVLVLWWAQHIAVHLKQAMLATWLDVDAWVNGFALKRFSESNWGSNEWMHNR